MRILSFTAALLLACATAASAWGVDLTKLDRTINKEPDYQGKPTYCLLVFGQEAKTRVWLVFDGKTLYVDRNGNGDLTEKGEQASPERPGAMNWHIGDIVEADGRTRHTDLRARFEQGAWLLFLRTADGIRQEVGNEFGALQFSETAPKAPIVHLAGPLTFLLRSEKRLELIPGKEAHFIAVIGTAGLGKGATAYCDYKDFETLKMAVEIEFSGRAPEAPVRVRGEYRGY